MIGGWVIEENLRPFLEAIGMYAGYEFSEDDWIAVEYRLLRRDPHPGETETTLHYPLQCERPVDLRLSFEPGTGVASFEVQADPDLETRSDALAFLAATYVFNRDRSSAAGRMPPTPPHAQ